MEKEELMKRIDEIISNDEKMKEIAEKLIALFVKKKERDLKFYAFYGGIFGVNIHNRFKNDKQAAEFLRWFRIDEKVRDIAYDLGVPSDEDWCNGNISKYLLRINEWHGEIEIVQHEIVKYSGVIYCLDENFLDVVKSKISNEDLIFWCKYTKP